MINADNSLPCLIRVYLRSSEFPLLFGFDFLTMVVMKKVFFILLTLVAQPLWAQVSTTPYNSVAGAQARVWDIGLQLNSAIFKLNTMKLDWQKDKLSEAMLKAQTDGDTAGMGKIKEKLIEIDHRKDLEKQKLDLNNQLITAKQQGDEGKADAILFQLKNLQ